MPIGCINSVFAYYKGFYRLPHCNEKNEIKNIEMLANKGFRV